MRQYQLQQKRRSKGPSNLHLQKSARVRLDGFVGIWIHRIIDNVLIHCQHSTANLRDNKNKNVEQN